jgi:type IV secretory pathway VirB2 component (pilin)
MKKLFKSNNSKGFLALAHAAAALTGLGTTLCGLVTALQGNTFVAIATFGVILLAIGAFFGKLNWGVVITVIVAIVVLFTASTLVVEIASAAGNANAAACP